ncbi:uncharacterized protein LOC131883712 isoform X1 [Tigriopus californicus]|uniref:uncharacterized protein LOC131883712 isoform X1 n=2 Tax=Tigriopus californicus TaxID=6832 RepID=UPI0027DA8704|nr:uncharacterized protein LOC131883712 isoform X1 [Tigriopus californicus]
MGQPKNKRPGNQARDVTVILGGMKSTLSLSYKSWLALRNPQVLVLLAFAVLTIVSHSATASVLHAKRNAPNLSDKDLSGGQVPLGWPQSTHKLYDWIDSLMDSYTNKLSYKLNGKSRLSKKAEKAMTGLVAFGDSYPRADRSQIPLPYPRIGKRTLLTPAIPMARMGRNPMIPQARFGRNDMNNPMIPMARLGRGGPMIPMARLGRGTPIIPVARMGRSGSFDNSLREDEGRNESMDAYDTFLDDYDGDYVVQNGGAF